MMQQIRIEEKKEEMLSPNAQVFTNKIPGPNSEQLAKICAVFKISRNEEDLSQVCFDKTREAIGRRKWEKLGPITNEISLLSNRIGRSLLMESIHSDSLHRVKDLIKRKIAIHRKDHKGNNALHHAILANKKNVLNFLKDHFSFNDTNSAKKSPLHLATEMGSIDLVKALLEGNARYNSKATYSSLKLSLTPFEVAVMNGQTAVLECFIDALKNKNWDFPSEKTLGNPLHMAIHFGHHDMLEFLIQKCPEKTKDLLEGKNPAGQTPLMLAAHRGVIEAIVILNDNKVNLEQKNPEGRRALHFAALGQQTTAVELLLYLGVDVNAQDNNNKPAMALIENAEDTAGKSTYTVFKNFMNHSESRKNELKLFRYRPPENLVFKGGGPKGIAYVGVLRALEKENVLGEVKRIAGTSAGAIQAAMIALGCNSSRMQNILDTTDMNSFLDHPFKDLKTRLVVALKNTNVGSSVRLLVKASKRIAKAVEKPLSLVQDVFTALYSTTGICKGETFRKWMEALVKEETGIKFCTFGELKGLITKGKRSELSGNYFKHLYVYTLCLDPQKIYCINSEDKKYEDIIISDAIRASMSIPAVFVPHTLHYKDEGRRLTKAWGSFVDGGMVANFPLDTFDKKKYQSTDRENGELPQFNKRTLGFFLYNEKQELNKKKQPREAENIGDLISGVMKIYQEAQNLIRELTPYNEHRTVKISDEGVSLLDFSLSDENKEKLIISGRNATSLFYKKQAFQEAKGSRFLQKYKTISHQLSNLGPADLRYTDRLSYQNALEDALLGDSREIDTCFLWGSSGLGKSELAKSFANENKDSFYFSFRIQANTPELCRKSYQDLLNRLKASIRDNESPAQSKLKKIKDDGSLAKLQNAIHSYLAEEKCEHPWLLIFDNANADQAVLDRYLKIPEKGHGRIILISNSKDSFRRYDDKSVEVKAFSENDALNFVENMNFDGDRDAKTLLKTLAYHPLAISYALFYIDETMDMSVAIYLKMLTEAIDNNTTALQASWDILSQKLHQKEALTMKALQFMAHLHPDHISDSLIDRWLPLQKEEVDEKYEQVNFNINNISSMKNRILCCLSDYRLVQEEDKSFSINRLQQSFILNEKNEMPQQLTQLLAQEAELLNCTEKNWNKISLWKIHATHFMENFSQDLDTKSQKIVQQIASIHSLCGEYFLHHKDYEKAILAFEEAIRMKTNSDANADVSNLYAACANIYLRKEEYERAIPQLTRALTLYEQRDKRLDAFAGDCYNKLALCYEDAKEYSRAKTARKKALNAYKDVFRSDHPLLVKTHRDLALCCYKLNSFGDARKHYKAVLQIQEKQEIPLKLENAQLYMHLGICCAENGEHKLAAKHFRASLRIYTKLVKGKDRRIALTYDALGKSYFEMDTKDEALKVFKKAHVIYVDLLGENHAITKAVAERKKSCESSCVIC